MNVLTTVQGVLCEPQHSLETKFLALCFLRDFSLQGSPQLLNTLREVLLPTLVGIAGSTEDAGQRVEVFRRLSFDKDEENSLKCYFFLGEMLRDWGEHLAFGREAAELKMQFAAAWNEAKPRVFIDERDRFYGLRLSPRLPPSGSLPSLLPDQPPSSIDEIAEIATPLPGEEWRQQQKMLGDLQQAQPTEELSVLAEQMKTLEEVGTARKLLMHQLFRKRVSLDTLYATLNRYQQTLIAEAVNLEALGQCSAPEFLATKRRAERELQLGEAVSRCFPTCLPVELSLSALITMRRVVVDHIQSIYGACPPFYAEYLEPNPTHSIRAKKGAEQAGREEGPVTLRKHTLEGLIDPEDDGQEGRVSSKCRAASTAEARRRSNCQMSFVAQNAEKRDTSPGATPCELPTQQRSFSHLAKLASKDQSVSTAHTRNAQTTNCFRSRNDRYYTAEHGVDGDECLSAQTANPTLTESALERHNSALRQRISSLKKNISLFSLQAAPTPLPTTKNTRLWTRGAAPLPAEPTSPEGLRCAYAEFAAIEEVYTARYQQLQRQMDLFAVDIAQRAQSFNPAEQLQRLRSTAPRPHRAGAVIPSN